MWRFSALLFLFLGALPCYAQVSAGNETRCTLRVDVEFANKGEPVVGASVELFEGFAGASPGRVGLTNSSGSAEFESLLPGDYRIEVSGEGIETTDLGNVHIESGRIFMSELVAVHAASGNAGAGKGCTVSVSDLNVPSKALQEFASGDSEMQRKNWKKAADRFKKAVSIYPQYSSAYYNLSIAYYQLGQKDNQRAALLKALGVDAHFVPALVSLAHVDFAGHDLLKARELLDTAIAADPTNVDGLALLVRVDFVQGRYTQAIADAQKVHSLPHQGYATVHYTAAAAYQQLNEIPQTIEQLKIYLKEDPTSPSAAYVRKTIADLENPHQ
ncbi:MAG TPA: tetratricopeptide repeat protein [Candidatus Acidoferrum sp.]|nr:tetratricopeptide repeat protein [Candidatus Acidoferrum sp.]